MGLFNNEAKEARKQFREQLDVQRDGADVGAIQQMNEQGNVAYDPQVSAMLLKQGDYFLDWLVDSERGVVKLNPKYKGFIEPGGMEPYSFLNEKNGDGEYLAEHDSVLTSILDYGDKYELDDNVRNSWNKLARKRMRFMNISRALEGKAQQLAKSQIIKSSGSITRFNDPKEKKSDKLLGVF
jgi:hypothetical protein